MRGWELQGDPQGCSAAPQPPQCLSPGSCWDLHSPWSQWVNGTHREHPGAGSMATTMAPSYGDGSDPGAPCSSQHSYGSIWELVVLWLPAPFPSWSQSWASQSCPCNSVSLTQSHYLHSPCPPALWALPGLWLCTGRPLQARGTDTCSACSRRALPHQQETWKWGRTAPTSP